MSSARTRRCLLTVAALSLIMTSVTLLRTNRSGLEMIGQVLSPVRPNVAVETAAPPVTSTIAVIESSGVLSKAEAFKFIQSVVQIRNSRGGGGSGVILRSELGGDKAFRTYVLTAAHVVRGDRSVQVIDFSYLLKLRVASRTTYTARVVDASMPIDTALLEFKTDRSLERHTKIVTETGLDGVTVYEPLYAVGCPNLESPSVTDGHLVSIDRMRIRFSAPIAGGNSGGPLFMRDGGLIGLVTGCDVQDGPMDLPFVVSHMAFGTPSTIIALWLRATGAGFLVGDKNSSLNGLLRRHPD